MKKLFTIAVTSALIFILTTCGSGSRTDIEPSDTPFVYERSSIETPESYRKLTDNVFINTDIVYPGETYNSYSAAHNIYTPQFLTDIFLTNDKSEQTVEASDWDANGFRLTTAEGSFIYSEDGSMSYDSPTYDIDKEILNIMQKYSQTESLINDVTFPFMSRDEAADISVSLINKMGMFGEPEIQAFVAMSHDEITAYQKELMKDSDYAYFAEIGKTALLDNLTEKDNAYYIRFAFKYNEISILDQRDEMPIQMAIDGDWPESTYAEILLTKDGIKLFSLSGALSASGKESGSQDLISVDELLDAVTAKYELQIVTVPMVFTNAYLEYMPVTANPTFDAGAERTLTPYWYLEYCDIESDGTLSPSGAERFNAITGKDFAYGG